ncbi:tRNA pseudouridine(38/39) synthase-like [Mya arenaria]|uniref:tRNA pseudouridine(38/39) synthase-like n=1 Tax=Mya arenaria TaxID=6604 RepID=UPI0022E3296B|nr:tRNA pseudouridine(38/39) synthase-like [Mya arenaria]
MLAQRKWNTLSELFQALIKCKLIESKYAHLSVTQTKVVFLDVRSNLLSGVGVKVREGMTAHERPGSAAGEERTSISSPKETLIYCSWNKLAKTLIGEYDFRNFCKFNVKDGITNYVRKIMEVEVKTLDETDDRFTMCELTIVGRAFLWHQIRSIFSVEVNKPNFTVSSSRVQNY